MEYSFFNELGVKEESSSTTDDYSISGVVGRMATTAATTTTLFESLPIDLIPLDDDVFSLELTGGSSCSGLYDTTTTNKTILQLLPLLRHCYRLQQRVLLPPPP
jgi:hypothetical protein